MKVYKLLFYFLLLFHFIFANENEIKTWINLNDLFSNNALKTYDYKEFNNYYKLSVKLGKKKEALITLKKIINFGNRKNRINAYFILSKFEKKFKNKELFLLRSLGLSKTYKEQIFSYKNIFKFYRKHKNYKLSAFYLKKCIELLENKHDYIQLEVLYNSLALLYRKMNNNLKSIFYFHKALDNSKKLKNDHSGYIHLNIAEDLKVYSKFELAKFHYNEALIYAEKKKNNYLKMVVLSALMSLYIEYDIDLPMALYYQKLAIDILEKKNFKRYFAGINFQIGLVYKKNGEYQKAEYYMRKTIEYDIHKRKRVNLIRIFDLFDLYEKINKPFKITKYMNDVDKMIKENYYFYYYIKAMLNYYSKDLNKSEIYFKKTIDCIDKALNRTYIFISPFINSRLKKILDFLFDYYIKRFDRTININYLKTAIYVTEIRNKYRYKIKTNIKKQINNQDFYKLDKKYQKLYKIYKRSLIENNLPKIRFYERQLVELKREFIEFNEFIGINFNSKKNWQYKNFNIENIIDKITKDKLILKYVFAYGNVYLFYFSKNRYGYIKLKSKKYEIYRNVEKLIEPIKDFINGEIDYLRIFYDLNLSNKLYEQLLKDILGKFSGIKKLYIIPSDILYKLPFETLVFDYKDKYSISPDIIFSEYSVAKYLIEKYEIIYGNSLFNLINNKKNTKKWKYFLAAFGYPIIKNYKFENIFNFNLNLNPLVKKLETTKKEINEIKKILKKHKRKMKILIGKGFTRRNVLNNINKAMIVHISTHYVVNKHSPLSSFILLTNYDKQSPFLYVYELAGIKLNPKLLILNVCESAETRLKGMENLFGLTNVVFSNNIESVILSMWPVDEINMKVMPYFYKYYIKYNDESKALRMAKLEIMKKIFKLPKSLKYSFYHPFLWSNYIIFRINNFIN